jgi:hypothetical protein
MSFTELNIKIEKIIGNSAFIKIKLILKMQILTVGYSADMQVNRIKNKCQEWSAGQADPRVREDSRIKVNHIQFAYLI